MLLDNPGWTLPLALVRGAAAPIASTLASLLAPPDQPAGPSHKLAERTYRFELAATLCFTLALATIEGGVVAVFAKQTFDGLVEARRLNIVVAALGAMSELANILSFVWSTVSHRRPVVQFVNALQVATILLIASIAILPASPSGLYLLLVVVLLARFCWSGILTLRTSVWRSNYHARERAVVVGKLASTQVFVVAATGACLGWMLDFDVRALRFSLPVLCTLAMAAVWFYSRVRVRREWKLKRAQSHSVMMPWHGPGVVLRVLRADRRYAQFMLCMFILGFGNLMMNPVLAITLKEEFGFRYLKSILVTSSIQAVIQVVAIPFWARFLDRSHVVRFRSIHSWVFVIASSTFMMGALFDRVEFMFAGSAILGIAYAGGSLAWNLGHVDFSPPSQTSLYMATHVTLNGVRGLLAPLVSVWCYELLKSRGFDAALWMFVASCIVNALGAAGFVALRISMGAEAARVARDG